MLLIHDPSVKRDHFYQDYAGQSHFRSLCSKLGSTVRKWVIAVALLYVAFVALLFYVHGMSGRSVNLT